MEEQHRIVWTSKELAQAAGLTVSYIRRLLRNNIIKGEHLGRDWVVLDSEAKRWLAQWKKGRK